MTLFNSICRKNYEERGGKNSHKCTNLFQFAIYLKYVHFFAGVRKTHFGHLNNH
jgi:hypothetical protein